MLPIRRAIALSSWMFRLGPEGTPALALVRFLLFLLFFLLVFLALFALLGGLLCRFGRGALGLVLLAPLASDLGHVLAIAADGVSALASDLRHVLPIFADRCPSFASNLGHVLAIAADGFAPLAPDLRHMPPVLTHCASSFASRLAGLLRSKLVRLSLDVGCLAPLAGNLTLLLLIHRGESAPRSLSHDGLLTA
jgi:hypothetical protein